MTRFYLAFYKGRGRWDDHAIRWITRSEFSHVEMLFSSRPPEEGETHSCFSASGRDGGVRHKVITFDPGKWVFVEIPWADHSKVFEVERAQTGKRYDYRGILLSHVFPVHRHAKNRWFCSELCAYALGFPMPHEWSPGRLYRVVKYMNQVVSNGFKLTFRAQS